MAHAHPGVNVNLLSPSGPAAFDPLSGMTHLTGIPVDVQRLACGSLVAADEEGGVPHLLVRPSAPWEGTS